MTRNFLTDAALRPQPKRAGPDDWTTPPDLVAMAVRHVLPLLPPGTIWEPAPGAGALADAFEAAGRTVVATRADFTTLAPPSGVRIALSNPPFNQLNEFIQHGLGLLDDGALDAVGWLWRWDHFMAAGRRDWVNRAFAVHFSTWRSRWIVGSIGNPRWTFAWIVWLAGFDGPPSLTAHERRAIGGVA